MQKTLKYVIIILAIVLLATLYFLFSVPASSESSDNTLRGEELQAETLAEGDYEYDPCELSTVECDVELEERSNDPTSPNKGEMWSDEGRFDWIEEDENSVPQNWKFYNGYKVFDVEFVDPETLTPEDIVKSKIVEMAEEVGFDVNLALMVADCESNFKQFAENPSSLSSAKGVYQFTNGTWAWIKAEGHQYDLEENISQFLKWFPVYPGWWESCL